jgi:hypothetical protein
MTDLCFKLIPLQYTVNPDLRQSLWICAADFRVIRQRGEAEGSGRESAGSHGKDNARQDSGAVFCGGLFLFPGIWYYFKEWSGDGEDRKKVNW